MNVAGPIIGWLLIFAIVFELVGFMVDRWGPM